jgi:hypothetical protein
MNDEQREDFYDYVEIAREHLRTAKQNVFDNDVEDATCAVDDAAEYVELALELIAEKKSRSRE